MDKLPFRLKVHKMKCTDCDLIYLVETHKYNAINMIVCPICEDGMDQGHMGDIVIVEENK